MSQGRICLITPGHLASTPRLVKEAGALADAGYAVRVVASDHYAPVRPLDESILSQVPWRCDRVRFTPGSRLLQKLGQQLARRRMRGRTAVGPTLATWSHSPHAWRLARAAGREPADLYLGHCIGGLAAAGAAAHRAGSRLGFDAEDFHRWENSDEPPPDVVAIEEHWLPRCAHVTASSPLIAEAYAQAGRMPAPAVVLNTFPLSERPIAPVQPARPEGVPTLYWFSQTIGPNRGLEAIVAALGTVGFPVHLHLRGIPAPGFRQALEELAARCGGGGWLRWHEPAAPDQMVRLAAVHDAGVSAEQTTPRNRALCLTNKIFTYVLAGIPTLLSDTPAHRQLRPELGDAADLVENSDPASVGIAIRHLLVAERLAQGRMTAWRLGRERYNWETDRTSFLASVRVALADRPA